MQDNPKYYKNSSNILKWKAKPSRDIQKTSRKNKPRCKIETKQQSSNKQKEIVNRPANKTVQKNPKHQMLYFRILQKGEVNKTQVPRAPCRSKFNCTRK